MLKILFYSHTGKVSGAENILLLALKHLDRGKFAPAAICPAEGGLADKIRELGIECRPVEKLEARFTWRIDLLIKYLISFWRTIKNLRREILRDEPDLIHANSIRAGLAATAATVRTGIPVFWHLQDELRRHPLSTLIRLFVFFSDRIRLIAASAATAGSFRGRLLSEKRPPWRVIHNVIETNRFRPDPEAGTKIRRELELDSEEFVVGIIGQITPRKGQLELIRVFAKNMRDMPSATLLIVGEPMFNKDHIYLEQIKEEIIRLKLDKRVRLLGQRRDVPAILSALDTLVVNSESEALVVVAIEAMACGTPVIATDVGGTREMITDRVNGLIVPWGDSRHLGEALKEISRETELRKSFADEGVRVVRQRLNAEKFMTDLESFFDHWVQKVKPGSDLLLSGS